MTNDAPAAVLSGECYHVGVVVADFEAGLRRYEALHGPFGPMVHSPVPVRVDGVITDVALKVAFSKAGPVRIELIGQEPGTLWMPRPGVHHRGFWSDDVAAERERLVAAGYPVAADLLVFGTDQPPPVVYHHDGEGGFIEIVAASMRDAISTLWA